MTADYNPFDAIDGVLERRRREEQQREEEERREKEWKQTWSAVFSTPDIESFLNLGAILRERECGFWLDYIEVCSARSQFVLERGLVPGFELSMIGHGYSVIVIRLLKFSFLQDVAALKNELQGIEGRELLRGVCEKISDYRDSAMSCMRPEIHPRTPYMSRNELAGALIRKITGLGTPSLITKAIKGDKIQVVEECLPAEDGKTLYARFQHSDPEIHAAMLRHAVDYLKKTANHCFFSGPIWTAEIAENGA